MLRRQEPQTDSQHLTVPEHYRESNPEFEVAIQHHQVSPQTKYSFPKMAYLNAFLQTLIKITFNEGWILSTGSKRGFLRFRFSIADCASAIAHLSIGWGKVFWTRSYSDHSSTVINRCAHQLLWQQIIVICTLSLLINDIFVKENRSNSGQSQYNWRVGLQNCASQWWERGRKRSMGHW